MIEGICVRNKCQIAIIQIWTRLYQEQEYWQEDERIVAQYTEYKNLKLKHTQKWDFVNELPCVALDQVYGCLGNTDDNTDNIDNTDDYKLR